MSQGKGKKKSGNQNVITDAELTKIKKLGDNIRECRKGHGWTLEQMEERGYKSWKHWQDIESGNRNVNFTTILRIAKILKVKLNELLADI